tara:strand:+ start:58 stop:1281 length:1224 start_codon:yes stop_codon:yes gene_type:complete
MEKRKVNFSRPFINNDVIKEVNDVFSNTGWLTSGPKVFELENKIKKINSTKSVICVNSWTSGAMLMLRWFNVSYGDEVIIPSYTYSATALCVMNLGAIPVMVDVKDDFTIDTRDLINKINYKTKVIIPVDIAGLPCDYDSINNIVKEQKVKKFFVPNGKNQKKLGRILIIGDCAHSLGAIYKNKPIGKATDLSIFSFHSVKNITTGEGGAISLNLPLQFDHNFEFKFLKALSLNGQTKSAFEKNKAGSWRYDIIDQGMKINMPDICAAVGLAQIKVYLKDLLPERKKIFNTYSDFFKDKPWALIPIGSDTKRESSYHLYMLRINNIDEKQRDLMINYLSDKKIGVNVHYIPMPMLTLFKNKGYNIKDYPNTYKLYSNEISLPIYNGLSKEDIFQVCEMVEEAYLNLN